MKSLNSIIGSGKVAKSIVALFSLGLSFLLFSLFARDQIQIDGSLEAQTYIQNIIYIFICVAVLILLIPYYNEINFKKIKYEHLIYAALIILLIGTLFHPRFNAKFIPVFGILTIINLIITKKAQKPEPILYYYIAAYIIFCIGLLWSNDRESGGNLLETKLAMLVYPIAFSFFTLKRDAAKTIMLIFFKAALIFTLASLLCWVL